MPLITARILLRLLLILAITVTGLACADEAGKQSTTAATAMSPLSIDPQRDHIRGAPDAEFSLIEYSDFACSFCRRFHPTAKRLINDSAGKVNWAYRHFPLNGHKPGAQQLAEAAECVAELGGTTAFWRFTDIIVMRPKRSRKSNDSSTLPAFVQKAARTAQVDTDALADCLKSGRQRARVLADEKRALQMALTGTPASVIINNKTGEWFVRQGAASLQTLKSDIAKLSNNFKTPPQAP